MKPIYLKTQSQILPLPFLHKVNLDRMFSHCFLYYKITSPFEK